MNQPILAAGFVVYAFVCQAFAQQMQQEVDTFSGCQDPQSICDIFHPDSEVINSCEGEICIETNYGWKIGLAVLNESGIFPKQWFIETGDELKLSSLNSCVVTKSDKTIIIAIPDSRTSCMMTIENSGFRYHEHFVSDPDSPCLEWVECRVPEPY